MKKSHWCAIAAGIGSDLNKAYAIGGYSAAVELTQEYIQKANNKGA